MGAAVFGQDVLAREQDARQKQGDALKFKLAPLSQALHADQTRLALYADPNDPSKPIAGKEKEYQQTLDNMTATIGQMRGILGDKQPGANPLEAGAGDVLAKLHITNHLKNHVAQVRQQNAAKYAGENKARAGEFAQGTAPNDLVQYRSQLEAAGYTPEQIQRAMEAKAGIVPKLTSDGVPYKGTDGKWYQNFKDASGQITPREMPPGYTGPTVSQKPTIKTDPATGHMAYVYPPDADNPNGRVVPVLDSNGKPFGNIKPQSVRYTVSHHFITFTDANGETHLVPVTTESSSTFGTMADENQKNGIADAPDPSPSAPTPEGPKTKHLKSLKASSGATDDPGLPKGSIDLGRKATPATNKAKTDYVEAVKLASVADQVAQKPDDAINQKRLAVALERAAAGRFTTQALDYIIKAGWGNTIEQWANNPSTGALPSDVVRQLVDGAHENLKAAKDAMDAAENMGSDASPGKKGKHSLKKAMSLPFNKGKTEAQVRADLEAHGYEVTP